MAGAHSEHATQDGVARALAHAHHVLPDQGPIGVFIHHNTLHAYQHLAFHEGVQRGARELGARPYLTLSQFAEAHRAGRIETADVDAEIASELGADADKLLRCGRTRASLWRAWMTLAPDAEDGAGLAFALEHGLPPAHLQPFSAALWRGMPVRRSPLATSISPSSLASGLAGLLSVTGRRWPKPRKRCASWPIGA